MSTPTPQTITVLNDVIVDTPKVTRLEIIGPDGRELVKYGVHVEIQVQDEGRTVKEFYNNVHN